MKDSELRGLVLRKFYEGRKSGLSLLLSPADFEAPVSNEDLFRICQQLNEYGLIEWMGPQSDGQTTGQMGQIKAPGVDVVEETSQPPISITVDQRKTITISGSNNIVGDNNSVSFERVDLEIERSSFSEAEKAEAKSIWKKVSENKLLNTAVSSVLSTATKTAIEVTTR